MQFPKHQILLKDAELKAYALNQPRLKIRQLRINAKQASLIGDLCLRRIMRPCHIHVSRDDR